MNNSYQNNNIIFAINLANNLIEIIKHNPQIDNKKSSVALIVLKNFKLAINNKNCQRPSEEDMKTTLEVICEIKNMQTDNEEEKRENENLLNTMKFMIDWLAPKDIK